MKTILATKGFLSTLAIAAAAVTAQAQPTAPLAGTYRLVVVDGPQGASADLTGINNHRQVAGYESNAGIGSPVLLGLFGDVNGTADVVVPGSTWTQLSAINDDGVAAGGAKVGQGPCEGVHAILYDGSGTITVLPDFAPSGTCNVGKAVDSRGRVLGNSYAHDYSTFLNWIWDPRAGFSNVPPVAGAIFTTAYDMNDDDTIVGEADFEESPSAGFVMNGSSTTLIAVPGAFFSTSQGINRHGDIVGFYYGPSLDPPNEVAFHGYLLHHGVMSTVDVPQAVGWTLLQSINDRGDLAGQYCDDTACHGFVMLRGDSA